MPCSAKKTIIVAWIGGTDQKKAIGGKESPGANGPIRSLTDVTPAQRIYLLVSKGLKEGAEKVRQWVLRGTKAECVLISTDVVDPTSYPEVYKATEKFFDKYTKREDTNFVFNVTPGTGTMQGVLLYLARVRCPGSRIVSVRDPQNVKPDAPQICDIAVPFKLPQNAWGGISSSTLSTNSHQDVLEIFAPQTDVSILLLGETGVGKSYFAREIHKASKVTGAFVPVNCALLGSDTNSLSSRLFGHVRGAYSGATKDREGAFRTAKDGTIFLDEIGEIPLGMQAALLTALNDKKITPLGSDTSEDIDNVRIIAATNRNLLQEVRAGHFREDLYYRICMCPVSLPALREIDQTRFREIVTDYLKKITGNHTIQNQTVREWKLTDGAWNLLFNYRWPGNRRELEHVLLLSCIVANYRAENKLTEDLISRYLAESEETIMTDSAATSRADNICSDIENKKLPNNLENWLEEIKFSIIREAMKRTGYTMSKAAKLLGMPYQKLQYCWNKIKTSS
jgi:DNA-binding NtrC family response regulator